METSNSQIQMVENFVSLVREYCSVIEESANLNKVEFLGRAYPLLPRLIGLAIALPQIQENGEAEDAESDDDLPKSSKSTHEERRRLFKLIEEKLGGWDRYWVVFDPNNDLDPIIGSLADDLVDIYFDLKEGLNLAELDKSEPSQAILEWRSSFDIHWGEHALGALRAIHFRLQGIS